jgi:hypothetical protein
MTGWASGGAGLYYLVSPRCPCYCGGEGLLMFVTCPQCATVMGRCDEVDELIQDVHHPKFIPEESICYPDQLCPKCGKARYGDFRPATPAEIRALGFRRSQYRKWLM